MTRNLKELGIVGPGAIGRYLACILHAQNRDLDLIGRTSIQSTAYELNGRIHTCPDVVVMPRQTHFNFLLIAVKVTSVREVCQRFEDNGVTADHYVFLHNGFLTDSSYGHLAGSQNRYNIVVCNGYRVDGRSIKVADTFQGWPAPVVGSLQPLYDLLQAADVPVRPCRDFIKRRNDKFLLNTCINSISAIERKTIGEVLQNNSLVSFLANIYVEANKVLSAKTGITCDKHDFMSMLEILDKVSDHKPSMLQDVENGRQTEISSLNGFVVEAAKQLSLSTPFNEEILRNFQNGFLVEQSADWHRFQKQVRSGLIPAIFASFSQERMV